MKSRVRVYSRGATDYRKIKARAAELGIAVEVMVGAIFEDYLSLAEVGDPCVRCQEEGRAPPAFTDDPGKVCARHYLKAKAEQERAAVGEG